MKSWKELKIWQKSTIIILLAVMCITVPVITYVGVMSFLTLATARSVEFSPYPVIRNGEFSYTLQYKIDGQIKEISDAFVIEAEDAGIWTFIEQFFGSSWEYQIESGESQRVLLEKENKKIYFDSHLYDCDGYYMADPTWSKKNIKYIEEPHIYVKEYGDSIIPKRKLSKEELLREYGVEIIMYKTSSPISNTYISRVVYIPGTIYLPIRLFQLPCIILIIFAYVEMRPRRKNSKKI